MPRKRSDQPASARSFVLGPGQRREIVIELLPGREFTPEDVGGSEDRDISVQLAADGMLLGGMTYRIDPFLKAPPPRGKPGRDCLRPAGDLLECLDLPGAKVRSVHVRKIREIFVPVTGPVPETDQIGYRRLAACRAASVIHAGPYGGLRRAGGALQRWVVQSGLHADGPMRVLYLQFGAERELQVPHGYVVERDADLITELQLPVA